MTRNRLVVSSYSTGSADLAHRLFEEVSQARRSYALALVEGGEFAGLGHYRQRLARSATHITLGEAAPYLFLQNYATNDVPYQKVTEAWLLLYHHALVVDDLADGHAQNSPATRDMAARLLERALNAWGGRDLDGLSGQLGIAFTRFYEEQMRAGRSPIGDVASLGHRAALVKYLAMILKVHCSGQLLDETEERAIECLLAGFQILDDVTDRAEDGHESGEPPQEELVAVVGDRASHLLRTGLINLAVPEHSDLRIFVERYADAVDAAVRTIRRPRLHPADRRTALPVASN
jgi:hypothetical protein